MCFILNNEEYAFLNNVDKGALSNAVNEIYEKYIEFMESDTDFPRFKLKKNPVQTYTTFNVDVGEKEIFLQGIGFVSFEGETPGDSWETVLIKRDKKEYSATFI